MVLGASTLHKRSRRAEHSPRRLISLPLTLWSVQRGPPGRRPCSPPASKTSHASPGPCRQEAF